MQLENPKISFIILSSPKLEDMVSILYAKNYQIIPIQGFYRNNYENSIIAYSDIENDEMRSDLIFLLNHFHQECGIIKYKGETGAKKVFKDGSEKPLGIVMYNTDSENMSYLHNGLSFSFVEAKRYWKPKSKDDFKIGMIVEYFNNNKWYQKEVKNPSEDYEKFFKLLVKYDKVRVASIR
jgi:hypothetical protein